jgi:hypothetical protein
MDDVYNQSDLEMLACDCLIRAGLSDAVARIVARDVAISEAAGDSDNGIAALLRDIRLLRYGRIFGDADLVVARPAPAVVSVNAGHGFAAAAVAEALPAIMEAAKSQGMAVLHLSQSSDPGAMASAMVDLANDGLAGVCVGAGGKAMAIRPGAQHIMRLDTGARSMLSDLLSLAPPETDSPLGGPVAYASWLTVLDPTVTGIDALLETLPSTGAAPRASGIAVAPDLLAQIVNA